MIWRRLRLAPGLLVLAALTIGFGFGATLAVVSVIDPLLVRRLPVRDPDQLVLLQATGTLQTIDSLPGPAMAQFASERDAVEAVLATAGVVQVEMTVGGQRVAVSRSAVSTNFFDVLGVRAELGQAFAPGEAAGTDRMIILSHAAWLRHFAADPGVIGRVVAVRDAPPAVGETIYTIRGVAPRGFLGVIAGTAPDFFVPVDSVGPGSWVHVVARLRPAVSRERALVALEPAFRRVVAMTDIPAIEKEQAMSRLVITPAGRGISAARDELGARPWLLLVIVSLALFVACANVAGLILTRAAGRRHQISIELALGATRGRLACRLLLEGTVIASLGLIAGLAVASGGSRLLAARLAIGPSPLIIVPGLDGRLAVFAAGLLLLTVLICGVLPAAIGARTAVSQGLRFRSGGLDRGARPSVIRRALVVAQIAISVILLSTTGLLARSLTHLQAFDLGFDTRRVLAVTLRDQNQRRPPGRDADELAVRIAQRARGTAGVAAAAFGSLPPLSGSEIGINIVPDAQPSAAPVHTLVTPAITPEYFDTLGLDITQGDTCPDPAAGPRPSVVINQRLRRALFHGANAVGERVRFVEGRRPPMTVVGIAADSTYVSLRETPRSVVYLCWVNGQVRILFNTVLFVRSVDRAAEPLAGVMQALVKSVDSDLTVHRAQTLERYRADSLRPDRLVAALAAGFTLITVLVAAVGLYGVISATVVRQTPEIGLRVALGADAGRVVRFVAAPALGVTAAGLILGLAGAAATSSLVSSLLFGLDAVDTVTWAAVGAILLLVCLAALAIPVRRALAIDPVSALRAE